MSLPAWAGAYIGIPYADKGRGHAGVDCWGLVQLVLSEVFGLQLPGYTAAYDTADDKRAGTQVIEAGALDGWHPTTAPRAGDMVVFRIAGRPWHCGVMVNAIQFIHAPNRDRHGAVLSVVPDRLDNPMWAPRVVAIYRHPSVSTEAPR